MEKITETGVVILAVLGFVAWLGGGKKWAFRTMLSALILAGVGAVGVLLYGYFMDKVAEHRMQKIHQCAIAKMADPKCEEAPKDSAFQFICPIYRISDNASPQQEEEALAAAEQECRGEIDPKEKSLHEQISQYRREHGIKEQVSQANQPKGDIFDQLAAQDAKKKLSTKACAAKMRTAYPHAYDDLDDATLTRKVLAKYPEYCDILDIQGSQ